MLSLNQVLVPVKESCKCLLIPSLATVYRVHMHPLLDFLILINYTPFLTQKFGGVCDLSKSVLF